MAEGVLEHPEMPKVLGLPIIEDPRLVKIARGLLYTQSCIFILSLAYGITQITLQLVLRRAVAEAESSSGEGAEKSLASGPGVSIIQSLASLGIPLTLLIFARAGIQGGHSDWIMLVTIADACGACCSCLAMVSSGASFIFYQVLTEWADGYDCSTAPAYGVLPFSQDSGSPALNQTLHRDPTPADVANCRVGMDDASHMFRLLGRLAIAAAIFGILDVLLCGFAARKASEVNRAMKQDLVFIGAPQPQPLDQVCTQPAGMGGTVVVIGQPIVIRPGEGFPGLPAVAASAAASGPLQAGTLPLAAVHRPASRPPRVVARE